MLKTNEMNFRLRKNFRNIDMVKENLKKVSAELGFEYLSIVRPDYNHTNNVAEIQILDEEEKPSLSGKNFVEVDGLVTNEESITLFSTNADCNLILMYDPIKKVIANIHAGWRGTFGKIAKNAIIKMKEEYNCNTKDIICCFCPSIRRCHFEVDEDVAKKCEEIFGYFGNLNEIILKGEQKEGKQKYYIDTVLINKNLLKNEGILEENIVDSNICSVCSKHKIHSRRAEGEEFELGCALIAIKNKK